jgi:uncharacterized membrane protein YuzA (DUF378 family)
VFCLGESSNASVGRKEEGMKKIAIIVAGLAAIFVTLNLKDKIEKWVKDREAENLASKAF